MRKYNRSKAKDFANHWTIVFCFDMLLFMKDILLTIDSLFEKNMVLWTNAWMGLTTVMLMLHAMTLQPRSFVIAMRTTMELENRDSVTVSIFIIKTSFICHCNMNYNGTGEHAHYCCRYHRNTPNLILN